MTTLITDEQRAELLANGRRSIEQDGFDPFPVVKLFTPNAGATWLLTEIDPGDPDRAFGLCDLRQGFPELGYVSLQELENLRGRWGLRIERDLYFRGDKPISAYAREAQLAGRIVA
ncbi:MAG: transposase [Burkholderiales bacterium 68-12]|nr:MAG: transposase [Burkholderiales bacterium 68-12]